MIGGRSCRGEDGEVSLSGSKTSWLSCLTWEYYKEQGSLIFSLRLLSLGAVSERIGSPIVFFVRGLSIGKGVAKCFMLSASRTCSSSDTSVTPQVSNLPRYVLLPLADRRIHLCTASDGEKNSDQLYSASVRTSASNRGLNEISAPTHSRKSLKVSKA